MLAESNRTVNRRSPDEQGIIRRMMPNFILCDRQCSQLGRIKAPRMDRLPFDLVCQVASDCKSNKICSNGFSFKEDAGHKHLHNSWLTPSATGNTSPASWSDLLLHTGLDKPRRHHCRSNFGQNSVSATTTEASDPVDHASAIHYLYSPVCRLRKHCLGWTDETTWREAWKMQPPCSSANCQHISVSRNSSRDRSWRWLRVAKRLKSGSLKQLLEVDFLITF